jgi:hypothetical protein
VGPVGALVDVFYAVVKLTTVDVPTAAWNGKLLTSLLLQEV